MRRVPKPLKNRFSTVRLVPNPAGTLFLRTKTDDDYNGYDWPIQTMLFYCIINKPSAGHFCAIPRLRGRTCGRAFCLARPKFVDSYVTMLPPWPSPFRGSLPKSAGPFRAQARSSELPASPSEAAGVQPLRTYWYCRVPSYSKSFKQPRWCLRAVQQIGAGLQLSVESEFERVQVNWTSLKP